MCRLAALRQQLEERLEYARAAEPPEPLPYAVPVAKFAGERTPGYTVYGEVVDGFQEFTVVMPRLSPVRLRSIKHVQHDRPIALRHCRQHVRLPSAGHAVIRTKPDSGIRQKCMSGIPSTRPRKLVKAPYFCRMASRKRTTWSLLCSPASSQSLTNVSLAICEEM